MKKIFLHFNAISIIDLDYIKACKWSSDLVLNAYFSRYNNINMSALFGPTGTSFRYDF